MYLTKLTRLAAGCALVALMGTSQSRQRSR